MEAGVKSAIPGEALSETKYTYPFFRFIQSIMLLISFTVHLPRVSTSQRSCHDVLRAAWHAPLSTPCLLLFFLIKIHFLSFPKRSSPVTLATTRSVLWDSSGELEVRCDPLLYTATVVIYTSSLVEPMGTLLLLLLSEDHKIYVNSNIIITKNNKYHLGLQSSCRTDTEIGSKR